MDPSQYLPEGYSPSKKEQATLNFIAKKAPRSIERFLPLLVSSMIDYNLSQKQITAGLHHLVDFYQKERKYEMTEEEKESYHKSMGIGIEYSDLEISIAVDKVLEENMEQLLERRYFAPSAFYMSLVSALLPWVDTKKTLAIIEEKMAQILGPKTEADLKPPAKTKKPKKEKVKKEKKVKDNEEEKESEFKEVDLEKLWTSVPQYNRYEQRPEIMEEHERVTGGKVFTRFPPEPNGFLHIGHSKAMFLNFGYARRVGGKTYLRFDDTNPSVEKDDFVEGIKHDVKWLGHEPFNVTYTSDYFDRLYDCAIDLIKRDLAYVDDQQKVDVALFRKEKKNPPCRDKYSVEENLRLFEMMRTGCFPAGSFTLRLKIDMAHPNPNMRDPIAYRIQYYPHNRTGDKWCIYPSYDFSHCLIDAFEHISHSMCSIEFGSRRDSYDWLTHILPVYRPMQWEFSRLELEGAVMSKRHINTLVTAGVLCGYDDPRLMTIAGLRRRGFPADAINKFCVSVGITRAKQTTSKHVLEHVIRTHLDAHADRAFLVIDPIKVTLRNIEPSEVIPIMRPVHPKDKSKGEREINISKVIYIERDDWRDEDEPGYYRMAPGKTVCLRYGYPITVVDSVKDESGKVCEIICDVIRPDQKLKKKVKGFIHWVSEHDSKDCEVRLYTNLFKGDKPDPENLIASVNTGSKVVYHKSKADPAIIGAAETVNTAFQCERVGYFAIDDDSSKDHIVLNRTVTLKESKDKI
ncbi:Glutaminyl-tRNA synthetase [Aduncisulcus paluster]|uniref:glutamine--tRNA ligase n=1 Tax=Aduncisulcus paluster TaxID=2918883 RepID=A0ABQ5KI66_9EUKA|nr:Glutaminyl-tRNA synthetase [Aduncisulcus paluster]